MTDLPTVVLVRGKPDDAELAAVLAAVAAAISSRTVPAGLAPARVLGTWSDPRRQLERMRRFAANLSSWDVPVGRS